MSHAQSFQGASSRTVDLTIYPVRGELAELPVLDPTGSWAVVG